MTSLIPPRYVNISSSAVYSDDVPDALFRTYTRLVGLAWRDERRIQLPVLSLDDLAVICHRKPRAMRLHLKQLSRRKLITYDGDHYAIRIRIVDPAAQGTASVPSFTRPVIAVAEDTGDACESHVSSVHSSALDDPALCVNLAALSEFQVNVRVLEARNVAALPHVKPDLIRAWGRELEARPNTRNLPGLLLYILSTTHQGPRTEARGGPRPRKREARTDRRMSEENSVQASLTRPHQVAEPDDIRVSEQLLANERVMLLVELAQEEGEPLDLCFARDLVQPYTVEQVAQVVAYSRTARGLTRSRLGYAISRLRTGELPVIVLPDPEPKNKRYGFGAACPVCDAVCQQREFCRMCGRCGDCCNCEQVVEDPALVEARQLWQAALRELQLQMTRETFCTWLKPTEVIGRENGKLCVEVENDYVKDWLSNRLLGTITRTVNGVAEEELEIEFVVKNEEKSFYKT